MNATRTGTSVSIFEINGKMFHVMSGAEQEGVCVLVACVSFLKSLVVRS